MPERTKLADVVMGIHHREFQCADGTTRTLLEVEPDQVKNGTRVFHVDLQGRETMVADWCALLYVGYWHMFERDLATPRTLVMDARACSWSAGGSVYLEVPDEDCRPGENYLEGWSEEEEKEGN